MEGGKCLQFPFGMFQGNVGGVSWSPLHLTSLLPSTVPQTSKATLIFSTLASPSHCALCKIPAQMSELLFDLKRICIKRTHPKNHRRTKTSHCPQHFFIRNASKGFRSLGRFYRKCIQELHSNFPPLNSELEPTFWILLLWCGLWIRAVLLLYPLFLFFPV